MTRLEVADRFSKMFKQSREDAGKSQEYLAKCLGVSKKTIQNWEAGIGSPSQMMGFMWFEALGISPMKYYLELLYPEKFEDLSADSPDDDITEALITIITELPAEYRRKLLYTMVGQHGSSVIGTIDMICANLHTPLRDRINIALAIATNYKIATVHNLDPHPERIQPDIDRLEKYIFSALDAVYSHKDCYSEIE